MQTVRIFRLKGLDKGTRARMREAQREAARVWMDCVERHHAARVERTRWPDREGCSEQPRAGATRCTVNRSK